jgi:SAM-dependent methyltransferase
MRPTFINPDTRDYDITSEYPYISADPNQGFRSKLPRSFLNKILLVESEEVEFIKLASDEIPAGSIVVDAGAGQCRYKEAFPRTRYIGLDMAIGDHAWDYSNLDVVGDLLGMPIKDNCVDAVICINVLEHIAEPIKFLSELNRILKKDGKLFLAVPQGYGEHQMPHDYFRFSLPGLEYVFNKTGFKIQFIRPMGGFFYFIGSWLKFMPSVILDSISNRLINRLLSVPFKLIFEYLIPIACFYLDRLDKGKGTTIYYGTYVTKET